MDKIYINQTNLRISLKTGVNITNALETKIIYIKPDRSSGSLNAEIENAINGIIYYDVLKTDTFLNQYRVWEFYAYIKFSDGRTARGESAKVIIYNK